MSCAFCGERLVGARFTVTVALVSAAGMTQESSAQAAHVPCVLSAITSGAVPVGWGDAVKVIDGNETAGFKRLAAARRPRLELVSG